MDERMQFVARRLADLGIPILRTIRGSGTFEGADAAWLDPHTLLLAGLFLAAEPPKPRKATQPTQASRKRRLETKRRRGETKRARQSRDLES